MKKKRARAASPACKKCAAMRYLNTKNYARLVTFGRRFLAKYDGGKYALTCGVDTGIGGFSRVGISLFMRNPCRLLFYPLNVRDWFPG